MGESSTNLTVAVNTDFDDIRSQAWRRSWGVNVLCEKMFHLPVKACPGQLTDTKNKILVKTQKLATTCIADYSGKSRVVQAVGFMVKPLDLVHHGFVDLDQP